MERAGFANGRADVAVVGAGLAGLGAARELMAAGLSVVVLEARDRVGGRLLNHTLEGGAVVELGGQWVGPTQDRVLALAEELGVGLFPTYIESEHFLAMDGNVERYGGEDFALPEDASADALREPVGLIHWAGTETAEVWNGYMDGAIRSGERTVREVLTAREPTHQG